MSFARGTNGTSVRAPFGGICKPVSFLYKKKKIILRIAVAFVFHMHKYETRSSSLPQELASLTLLRWKHRSPGFKSQYLSKKTTLIKLILDKKQQMVPLLVMNRLELRVSSNPWSQWSEKHWNGRHNETCFSLQQSMALVWHSST